MLVSACAAIMTASASIAETAPDLADLSIQELMALKVAEVSTPSRFPQKPADAPASVTVITAEEIKLFGYRTLAEALQSVRGFHVTYDRSYAYVGVRGFSRPSDYNSRILVLVDGHRLNENIFGSVLMGREFVLDVDIIDRIEVVRGPTSSLYGSGAFFGVVNVITKRSADLAPMEASVEAGSFGARKARVAFAGKAGGVEYVLWGSYFASEGPQRLHFPEFDAPETNGGIAEDLDGEWADNLYLRLAWGDWTLSAAYVWRKKDIPTASWDTFFNDPRNHAVDARWYGDLAWRRALSPASEARVRFSFDGYLYTADYPIEPETADTAGLGRDETHGSAIGAEALWTRRWAAHTLTLGAETHRHLRQDQSYSLVRPRDVLFDSRRDSADYGVYAQDQYSIGSNLLLNAGARWDHYESFGGAFNPRLSLIFHPWQSGALKLLYGTAYRAPNVYELFYETPGEWLPNPKLKPERIETHETVFEQAMPGGLAVALCVYRFHLSDLIAQADEMPFMFQNRGNATGVGAEIELEWRHRRGVQTRASYARQRAEDDETGSRLPNSPKNLLKFNLMAPVWRDRLHTGVEAQYTSLMLNPVERETPSVDGYWTANWTLFSRALVKGMDVSATVYNLFDTRYAFPSAGEFLQEKIEQDGRTLRVKLTYRF
jgi:iron complex outermembrane receptor protein